MDPDWPVSPPDTDTPSRELPTGEALGFWAVITHNDRVVAPVLGMRRRRLAPAAVAVKLETTLGAPFPATRCVTGQREPLGRRRDLTVT